MPYATNGIDAISRSAENIPGFRRSQGAVFTGTCALRISRSRDDRWARTSRGAAAGDSAPAATRRPRRAARRSPDRRPGAGRPPSCWPRRDHVRTAATSLHRSGRARGTASRPGCRLEPAPTSTRSRRSRIFPQPASRVKFPVLDIGSTCFDKKWDLKPRSAGGFAPRSGRRRDAPSHWRRKWFAQGSGRK